jgi:hypothetical protein
MKELLQARHRIHPLATPTTQNHQTPAGQFNLQQFANGVMTVAQGAIVVAQGLQQIDRACPGLCEPYREDWR